MNHQHVFFPRSVFRVTFLQTAMDITDIIRCGSQLEPVDQDILHLFHQLPLGHQKPSILEDLHMKTGCSSAQQSVGCFTERHPAIKHGGISQATPRNRGSTWEILVMFSRHSFAVKCKMPCCITDFKSTEPRKTQFFGAWIAPSSSHSHKQQS